MERAVVNEEYDFHTYPELLDESNWDKFKADKLKYIKSVTLWNGDKITVKSVDNIKMWKTDKRTVKLYADVTYQKSFY